MSCLTMSEMDWKNTLSLFYNYDITHKEFPYLDEELPHR